MWVINSNGNFENGDYIQSSGLSGYGVDDSDDEVCDTIADTPIFGLLFF